MFCLIVVYKHGHAYVITSTEGHVEAQKWMGDEFKGSKHRRGVVAMSRCVAKQRTVMVDTCSCVGLCMSDTRETLTSLEQSVQTYSVCPPTL